jgi:hypothetical protein
VDHQGLARNVFNLDPSEQKLTYYIKEERARGMSEMCLGSISTSLWTYTRFLSAHAVQASYCVVETPESSGLIPAVDTVVIPFLPYNSAEQTRHL